MISTRLDRFGLPVIALLLIAATLLTDPSLREFSSSLSAICVMGLLWRSIGTYRRMDLLAKVLAVALMINLATAAVAQYLLAHPEHSPLAEGPPPPTNLVGVSLVLVARGFTLAVVLFWEYFLIERGAHVHE